MGKITLCDAFYNDVFADSALISSADAAAGMTCLLCITTSLERRRQQRPRFPASLDCCSVVYSRLPSFHTVRLKPFARLHAAVILLLLCKEDWIHMAIITHPGVAATFGRKGRGQGHRIGNCSMCDFALGNL